MATITIELNDEDRRRVDARAAELGYASAEAFLRSLVESEVECRLSDELEAELLDALKSPARDMTAADWAEKRRRFVAQHGQAKAG